MQNNVELRYDHLLFDLTFEAHMNKHIIRYIRKAQHILLALILTQIIPASHANTHQQEQNAKAMIIQLYSELAKTPTENMANRLEIISHYFLGKPYLLGALGEGENARYDQSPRYRKDGFDCETIVDTVLAIALASNVEGFEQCIDRIRYKNGQVDFITRNHFTDLDWNKNNQNQGYLVDITQQITDKTKQPIAQIATAIINKPAWYQHLKSAVIKLERADKNEREMRLVELQERGKQLAITPISIPYIPLSILFDKQGNANLTLFSQIPHGAIIEIIRPNWDLREQIGTCLNISHLGFVFWKKNQLLFRQASSNLRQIRDVSLINYLKEARASPTIKGINIQIVKPVSPICNSGTSDRGEKPVHKFDNLTDNLNQLAD